MSDKNLKLREKEEIQTPTEHTRPGPFFSPDVDIFETDDEITVLADMPGVDNKGIEIDLREGQLTITGEVESQGSKREHPILSEYETGRFQRAFTLSDRIDQNNISASLKEGVLRLVLPKSEKVKPRKIEVKTS